MSFTVLVPARLASSRLPGKPLADIGGLPMVVRVAQRAALSGAARVVVAADDVQIVRACERHGVDAILTRADHATGSDRLAEACEQLGLDGDAAVVNVQGDEPLIEPALILACAELLAARPDCVMSTAAHAIDSAGDFANPNVVKVVLDAAGYALYFSRATIPWARDAFAAARDALPAGLPLYRHYGLHPVAYETNVLIEDGRAWFKSEASIRILSRLGLPWSIAVVGRVLPLGLRDRMYDVVARNRLRWFGAREVCYAPRAEDADRLL